MAAKKMRLSLVPCIQATFALLEQRSHAYRRRRGSRSHVSQGGAASTSDTNAGARDHVMPLGLDVRQQGAFKSKLKSLPQN